MGYTEFTDRTGRSWRVWQTVPRLADILTSLAPDWKQGWLTFESEGERRRLAPVPAEWENLPPSHLALLCQRARPATQSPQTNRPSSSEGRNNP